MLHASLCPVLLPGVPHVVLHVQSANTMPAAVQASYSSMTLQHSKQAAACSQLQKELAGSGKALQQLQGQLKQQEAVSVQDQAQLVSSSAHRQQLEQELEKAQQAYITCMVSPCCCAV